MAKQSDGGPAFPLTVKEPHGDWANDRHFPGLSLRDWFAGQALVSLSLAAMERSKFPGETSDGSDGGAVETIEWNAHRESTQWGEAAAIADVAYQLADAMLKAREAQS